MLERPRNAGRRLAWLPLALACTARPEVDAPRHAETRPRPSTAAPSATAAATSLPSVVPDAGSAPATADAAPERRAYRVAAMGDSLTDARSHGGGYLRYLAERCPESRFDNFGKGGQMVNQMRRRFAREILGRAEEARDAAAPAGAATYTHVIVFGGVNDVYSDLTAGRTPAKIEADLATMYELARGAGVQVVALTIAPWGGFTRYFNAKRQAATLEVNEWIRARRAAGEIAHVVDAYALLSCGDPQRLCAALTEPFNDGIHFGKEGHRILGAALHEQVFPDCR